MTPTVRAVESSRFSASRRSGTLVAAVLALPAALAVVFLLLPVTGTDLSAAVARSDFAAAHPLTPLDLRWYGGSQQFGYSLLAQYVSVAIGARVAGAVSAAVASWAFWLLLRRLNVRRPVLGSLAGSLCIFGNLVSGRMAYSVGLAFALCGLAVYAHGHRRWALLLVVLASASSPVIGLFLGLVAVSMLVAKQPWAAVLAVGAAVPLAVTGFLFGDGGINTVSWSDTYHPLLFCAAVGLLVPHRVVRVGAALSALGLIAAFLLSTPVGLNAGRLPIMFALPILVACAPLWTPLTLLVSGLLIVWQAPLTTRDLHKGPDVTSSHAYFAPLLRQLEARHPTGRVEVPPLKNYWESAYVAREFPMARGWLRQLDIKRNGLFFDGSLTAGSYAEWLKDNAVEYVAVSRSRPSWVGRREAALVDGGLPYLRLVWQNDDWALYSVTEPVPLVARPGRLTRTDGASITFTVPGPGSYEVRIRDSSWLTLHGPGCLRRRGDGWVAVDASTAGTFTLGSSLDPIGRGRC